MKDLTEEQKELISQKQKDYHCFSNKVILLENELAELSSEKSEKLSEYEKAKGEYIKVEGILTSNNFGFDIKKNEYVNKQEFRYVFTLLFKSFMFFASINVIISLLGFIDIISFKDVISNFFCAPLFGGAMILLGAGFFSDNIRKKIIKRFYELDETKSLLETLEKNEQNSLEKKKVYEEKKTNYQDCKCRMEELEHKIRCSKYEMEKIKNSIFDIIYSTIDEELDSNMSLNLRK